MTIRKEWTCDKKGCPSTDSGGRSYKGPYGWIRLSWFGTYAPTEFCSTACLRDWLMDIVPVPDPSLGIVFTCDSCAKEILMRPGDEWPVWIEMKQRKGPSVRLGFCSDECSWNWASDLCWGGDE